MTSRMTHPRLRPRGARRTTPCLGLAPVAAALAAMLAAMLGTPSADARTVDAGAPFGVLPLVDEVDCAAEGAGSSRHPFHEDPPGASRIETILGKKCRVLPNVGGAKLFAYRLGGGKALEAGKA
ncbi:MAG: hypothetical protein ACYS9X_19175, partial [Planctomycetota bacterium]